MELSLRTEFYPCGVPEGLPVVTAGPPTTRAGLLGLEEAMRSVPDQIDIPSRTSHRFAPGLYVRQYDMLAGETVVGKIHKHDHFAMLVYGEVRVVDEFGNVFMRGPHLWLSTAGVKRAVHALTDASFLTFHPTDETDLEKIEDHVIAPSYDALDAFIQGRAQIAQEASQ